MSFELAPKNYEKLQKLFLRYPKKSAATLPALWIVQEQEGCIPMDAFEYLAKELETTPMEVYKTATFYTMFHIVKPVGKYHIQVCKTLSCMLNGRDELIKTVEKTLGIKPNETTKDGKFTLSLVECMGACGGAPMACMNETYYEKLTPQTLEKIIKELQ